MVGIGERRRVLGAEGEDGEAVVEGDRGMIRRLHIRGLRGIVRLDQRGVGGLGFGAVLRGERRLGIWLAGLGIDSLKCSNEGEDGLVVGEIVGVLSRDHRGVVRGRARVLDMRVLGLDLLHGDKGRDFGVMKLIVIGGIIVALQTLLYPTPRAFHPSISIPWNACSV
jgi:hypothetical protein